MKKIFPFFINFILILALYSCGTKPYSSTEFVLGTVCTINVYRGETSKAVNNAFKELRLLDSMMSANTENSYIALINQNAGNLPVTVPQDLFNVTEKSIYYANMSDGAFDPTIGALVKLWNIGMEGENKPTDIDISKKLLLVDYNCVQLDKDKSTIFLTKPGMKLDLGGIAKGYAADVVSDVLKKNGVKSALVDLGGNIKVFGKKKDNSVWKIGVQNPFDSRGTRLGIISLKNDATVVTSGIYERYFVGNDGRHYHHILDSKTGYPCDNGLASVTIIAESSIDADALSTALFAMGKEKGLLFAESLSGIEALFIGIDKKMIATKGFYNLFELEDNSFSFELNK